MKSIPYKDVASGELVLALFEHDVWTAAIEQNLSIVRQKEFCYSLSPDGELRIKLAILSASHLVSIKAPAFSLTEILSCRRDFTISPTHFQACDVITSGVSRCEYSYTSDWGSYVFKLWKETFHGGEPRASFTGRKGEEHLYHSDTILSCHFPHGRSRQTPFTTIGIRYRDMELTVRSVHCYPQEKVNILSESLVRLDRNHFAGDQMAAKLSTTHEVGIR